MTLMVRRGLKETQESWELIVLVEHQWVGQLMVMWFQHIAKVSQRGAGFQNHLKASHELSSILRLGKS